MGTKQTMPEYHPWKIGVSCSMHLYELALPAWLKWGFQEGLQRFGSLAFSKPHIPLLPSQAQPQASEPIQYQSQNSSSCPMLGRGASPAAGSPSPVKGTDIPYGDGGLAVPTAETSPWTVFFLSLFPHSGKSFCHNSC